MLRMHCYGAVVIVVFCINSGGSVTPDESLAELHTEFWDWLSKVSPYLASSSGDNRYNDRIYNANWTQYLPRKLKCDGFLSRLTQIERTKLPRDDQITYDVFHSMLQTYINGYKWVEYCAMNSFNFLDGLSTDPSSIWSSSSFNTIGDLANYLARLMRYPQQLDEMIERARKSIDPPGFPLHNVSMNRIPDQINKMQVDDPTFSTIFTPFNDTLDMLIEDNGVAEEAKVLMKAMGANATRKILEKYQEVNEFLTTTYMPHTRRGYGLSTFGNNGKLLYQDYLKWQTSTDMTAEQVHQKGLDEVTRISGEMHKVMSKLNFSGSIKAFFDMLMEQEKFHRNTSAELTAMYEDLIKTAEDKLSPLFEDYPGLPVIVVEMTNDGPGGMYSEGSEDGSRPGVFHVNNLRPRETPTFDMPALTLHETVPGHHLQIGNYQMKASLPKFRKHTTYDMTTVPFAFPAYTAYVEGWALYAEFLGEEMGMYKDDYELMGRYGSEIFRACRLVVDTGLHYYSWDREDAIEYMLNYTAYSRGSIEVEVDRYCTWPGQATAYKIGELKIRELRSKAERDLGDKFDIKGFHSTVLNNGPVPLSVLETLINDWIDSVKVVPDHTSSAVTSSFTMELLGLLLFLHILTS